MLHRDVLSVRRDIEARADEALARLDAVQVLEGDGPERPGVRRKSSQHEDEAQNGASPSQAESEHIDASSFSCRPEGARSGCVRTIGRASCREGVCQNGEISVVPLTLKKKKIH